MAEDRKANVRGDYMAATNQKEIIANLKKIKHRKQYKYSINKFK